MESVPLSDLSGRELKSRLWKILHSRLDRGYAAGSMTDVHKDY